MPLECEKTTQIKLYKENLEPSPHNRHFDKEYELRRNTRLIILLMT